MCTGLYEVEHWPAMMAASGTMTWEFATAECVEHVFVGPLLIYAGARKLGEYTTAVTRCQSRVYCAKETASGFTGRPGNEAAREYLTCKGVLRTELALSPVVP